MKPLKGRVKEGRKISDKQPFSEIISDYFFHKPCQNGASQSQVRARLPAIAAAATVGP
jgi:hypothetical protein